MSILTILACLCLPAFALDFPGPPPGKAVGKAITPQVLSLSNGALSASWAVDGASLHPVSLTNALARQGLEPPKEAFVLEFQNGTRLQASRLRASAFKVVALPGRADAVSLGARIPGQQVSALLTAPDGSLRVEWRAILRDDANYIRQEIRIHPLKGEVDLARVVLVNQWMKGAEVAGQVSGSPLVTGTVFLALEHPMALARVEPSDGPTNAPTRGLSLAQAWLDLALPLQAGRTLDLSSVIGVAPEGQLRRGFLHYLERERAHPSRPFLHYNSWYDIGYFTPYDEQDCLRVIQSFGEELVRKRGVKLDAFVFDDGWDDTSKGGQWAFHKGFPKGFLPVREAAARVGAAPGVWLSPWGGYGPPRIARRKSGQVQGYEVVLDPTESDPDYGQLFALSGPKYYESFHRACLDMVKTHGITHFKLDGTGSLSTVIPGSRYSNDFEAAIALIRDLREAKPDLFINLTTGTWPSPFWLTICDSIWRGGEDHDFEGAGSDRERWITYRDADTYARIVQGGRLFPLNALMLHGVLFAKEARGLSTDPTHAFAHEVRSYFGSGTQLQELYVSPALLDREAWDTLAESATWARDNAPTLVDTHWVGGDPRKLELYGWASWSKEKAILTLRNPAPEAQILSVDLAKAFELPVDAPSLYRIRAPFKQRDLPGWTGSLNPYKPAPITLKPFEVIVLEFLPNPMAAQQTPVRERSGP